MIDAGDPWIEEKIKIVDETLSTIDARQMRIYIFNKSDTINETKKELLKEKFHELNPILISAHMNNGIDYLKQEILHVLRRHKD